MQHELLPSESLSEVAFVHDYLQLRFQEQVISIFNDILCESASISTRSGESGFCDAVVALIGQRVIEVADEPGFFLSLRFQGGCALRVLADDPAISGPEAWIYHSAGVPIAVCQNV
jgi:hypothetical protein